MSARVRVRPPRAMYGARLLAFLWLQLLSLRLMYDAYALHVLMAQFMMVSRLLGAPADAQ